MMKILFFGTKSYDEKYFKEDLAQERFQEIDVHFIEPDLTPDTAKLAEGYDAVCAFVNMDLGKKTILILNEIGVKLILMRCAGYNNVDLEEA
ncbi:MAG: 2-hydroxyacid dehydrogenase, partial [Lachnospiraceae bacterium]|nr:2-hydroxyacid dehydrogenase [Lachnospiraceae bacterium]MDD7079018.1 2-hydroxyacid dehydrogenase [Lachnospiraceae bacterium]MDY3729783.1 2-hydroxyacid dehydrogenase [Candidatus Choladocola sp.]